MSVAAADLQSPKGDLVPTLFPSDSAAQLTTRLEGYIAEGVAKAAALAGAALDAAVTAWAYYRAYRAIYVRLLDTPTTFTVAGELTEERSVTQADRVRQLADGYKAQFDAAVAAAEATPARPRALPSSSTACEVTW